MRYHAKTSPKPLQTTQTQMQPKPKTINLLKIASKRSGMKLISLVSCQDPKPNLQTFQGKINALGVNAKFGKNQFQIFQVQNPSFMTKSNSS